MSDFTKSYIIDPGDNTYGHTLRHIQTGDGKRYNALEDICDTIGILALDTALIDTVHAGSIRIQIEKKCIIWGSPDKNTRNYDSGWSL